MQKLLFSICFFSFLSGNAQNNSIQFNGSNQYVSIPNNSNLALSNNFTFEGWVFPTGTGSGGAQGGMILNKENSYELARFADGSLQYAFSANGLGTDWAWVNTSIIPL